mmetsp:Transcript_9501/g.21229  ORF Transcript_9501/g.21229 Transcript_9501/m.21229 type:complete len:1072 (+) Transcript_9501:138-3353(+)
MESGSDDDEFDTFEANEGSRYPVHDCVEFEDADSLRRLIFVRQDESEDDSDSDSDSSSSDSSSDDNDSHAAAHAAAIGHSPELTRAPLGSGTIGGDATASALVADASKDGEDETEADTPPKMEIDTSAAGPAANGEEFGSIKKEKKKKKKTPKPPKEPEYYCPHNLDERDFDENTPIHVAIHACKLEQVKLLLQAGAAHHKKCDGSYPVHLAISMGAIPKHAAFAYDCIKLLRTHGADLSMRDDSLHTPLYLACAFNLPSVLALLLADEAGIQTLNLRADRVGGRALHAAAKFDRVAPGTIAPDASRHHESESTKPQHRDHHGHGHRPSFGGKTMAADPTAPAGADGEEAGAGDAAANSESALPGVSPSSQPTSPPMAVVTQMLLSTEGIEVDPPNNYGRTPLHIACYHGNWPVARLLLQRGAAALALDKRGYTPGRIAQRRGMVIPNDILSVLMPTGPPGSAMHEPTRDLIMDPDSTTMLICHELCSRHMSCPPIDRSGGPSSDPPPENIRRLRVLLNDETGILRSSEFSALSWESEARRASIADVMKVHEYNYVESISQACASLPDHPSAIANLDADTAISRWSFEAAMRAAGSVCEAVDKVMSGDFRNAFCAVRPPGHHAGPRGIVKCPNDPEGSHGFCLLNNVAIGAAYARSMYRNDGIQRIAIIDFDVHHGNGTEEIIKQLVPNIDRAAVRTPFAVGALHIPRYKPWLNEDDVHDVFFSSTHGFGPRDIRFTDQQGGWFYPASGQTRTTDAINNPSRIENPSLSDFLLSQTWTRMGEDSRSNCCKIINVGLDLPRPSDVPGMQRVEFRDSYRKNILPHLMDFDPDLIFISAGFDAHKKDTMNFGYVGMVEDDYEWVTEQLVKVANTCCNGRVISVLEGGYKIHGGIVSPFARSVAHHVRALVDGGSSRELYDKQDEDWESQFERHMVEEKERRRQMKMERFSRPVDMAVHHDHSLRQHHAVSDATTDIIAAGAIGTGLTPLHVGGAELEQHEGDAEGEGVAGGMEALMQGPMDVHAEINTSSNEGIGEAGDGEDGVEEPSRKRRRNNVDYKDLYEQMKKEDGEGSK